MNATTSTGSNQPNVIQSVHLNLLELDCQLSTGELMQWENAGYALTFDELVTRLWCHREVSGQKRLTKEQLCFALGNIESHRRQDILGTFRKLLKHEPGLPDKFDELARLVAVDNYEAMYPDVFRHVVWTVKRRLFGLTDYCPIFLNVFGSAGIGKSEFIKAMFSIFPPSLKSSVSNAAELFNDERQTFRFVQNYVIVMDELTGLNKADLNKLKNQIDLLIVIYRMLGYNKTASGKNNAQLIGSSNTRLANTLITDRDIRKWAEVDMWAYPDEEVSEKMVRPLQQFDWLTLWKSVDENGPSPFQNPDTYAKFKRWTAEKCETETPTAIWIKQLVRSHGGELISLPDLYAEYIQTVKEKHLSRSNFQEKIEKYGFRKHKTSKKQGYIVPKTGADAFFVDKEEIAI